MSEQPSRPAGFSQGDRRQNRAVEDIERARLRIRKAIRKTETLQPDATIVDVIRVVNDLRRALVD